jgi:DNA-binding NtrC family response regulator
VAHRSTGGIVGDSPAIRRMLGLIDQVAPSRSTVLIVGETGTGKEMVAQSIHAASPRANGPFEAVHCGGVTEALLDSQLFGHVRGAFTGAVGNHDGYLKRADRGTLFLDEVETMSAPLQVKLLRVLQERKFERVGDNAQTAIDVRVIAATNIPLERLVERGEFREDLYFRLNVVQIAVPPLRERKGDIPLIARFFVDKYSRQNGKAGLSLDSQVIESLVRFRWPGNVRELENVIEKAVVLSKGDRLSVELPTSAAVLPPNRTEVSSPDPSPGGPPTRWDLAWSLLQRHPSYGDWLELDSATKELIGRLVEVLGPSADDDPKAILRNLKVPMAWPAADALKWACALTCAVWAADKRPRTASEMNQLLGLTQAGRAAHSDLRGFVRNFLERATYEEHQSKPPEVGPSR